MHISIKKGKREVHTLIAYIDKELNCRHVSVLLGKKLFITPYILYNPNLLMLSCNRRVRKFQSSKKEVPITKNVKKKYTKNVCKVVVGGEGAVGKTTLCQRLAGTLEKEKERLMTVGIDFHDIKREDGRLVEAQVWDLGGQNQFRGIQEPFFKKANIVIIVFSVEWYDTFSRIEFWLNMLKFKNPKKIYLIGNKSDCFNRMITTAEALDFAQERNMVYYEISALEGYGFEYFNENLINTILSIVSNE